MTDTQIRNPAAEIATETSEPILTDKLTLAIIPTGEYYRGRNTVADLKDKSKNAITFYLPNKDGHLVNTDETTNEITAHKEINWGYASTHSPEARAEMLYDAIFNKKLDYIYITGGRGNEYTIIELDKLIKARKPELGKMPIVSGSSDATNLLNYLGQNGIARPYIGGIFDLFSFNNPEGKPKPIEEGKLKQEITRFDGQADKVEGVLIPEYLLRSYGTIQETRLFKDKVNFLATEIHFPGEARLMIEAYGGINQKDKENIVFCLSAIGKTHMTEDERKNYEENIKKEYREKNGKEISKEEMANEMKILESKLRHNQNKAREQEEFRKWCIENGFRVIEGIKFGHQNNPDQYLPIPSYCKCELKGNSLQYSTEIVPFPTDSLGVEIQQQSGKEKCHTITFDENYNGGGGSEVSAFIVERKKSVDQSVFTTIFSKSRYFETNRFLKGRFNVNFYSSKKFEKSPGTPLSVYIQDLERVLKDIDKLKLDGIKEIKISGFDLPLDAKVDSMYKMDEKGKVYFYQGKEKRTNREAIIEICSYISKNYANLKNVKISLGNGLEFINGRHFDKSKSPCIIM